MITSYQIWVVLPTCSDKLIYSCAKKRSVWDHNVTHMHSLSLHGYGSKLGTPKLWMVNTKLDIHICGLLGLPFWPTSTCFRICHNQVQTARLVGWLQWRCGIDISDLGGFSSVSFVSTLSAWRSRSCKGRTVLYLQSKIKMATLSGTEVAKLQWHQFFQVSQKNASGSVSGGKKTMNVHNILYPPLTSPEVFFVNEAFFRS